VHPIERLRYVARSSVYDHGALVHETVSALTGLRLDPAGIVTACRRMVERHPESGPLWWMCSRVLVAPDPIDEAWRCAAEVDDDDTVEELRFAIPDGATVAIVGWPERTSNALARRGDLRVWVIDATGSGDGEGLVHQLEARDIDAMAVGPASVGAAAAAADLVIVETDAASEASLLAADGSMALASCAYVSGTPVWAVTGVGRVLPQVTYDHLLERGVATSMEPGPSVHRRGRRDDGVEQVPSGIISHVAGPSGVTDSADGFGAAAATVPVAPELFKTVAF
jgi:hypothetical protein